MSEDGARLPSRHRTDPRGGGRDPATIEATMTTHCAATTRGGKPCQARALPGRPFCLFHDPDRAAALTLSHRRGGAAPRRSLRAADLSLRLTRLLRQARLRPESIPYRQLETVARLARRWRRTLQDPAASRARLGRTAARLAARLDTLFARTGNSSTASTGHGHSPRSSCGTSDVHDI
jgi:hypothetical protein